METIKELGCTPLSEFSHLPDKAVLKVACILEDIQVRISAKTQKKFAITKIGDGGELYEMPIWPELFEAKGKILDDNALLIAVIQIDKKEEPLKIHCKWIEDITKLDEKLPEEFEEAYQDAKKFSLKSEKREAKMEKEVKKGVKLHVDIDKISLAKVLELKRLVAESPGGQAVDIVFQSNQKGIATVSVDAGRGVNLTPELEAKIKNLPYVTEILLV
jgi:DNA polymerase-3 subunit alpha